MCPWPLAGPLPPFLGKFIEVPPSLLNCILWFPSGKTDELASVFTEENRYQSMIPISGRNLGWISKSTPSKGLKSLSKEFYFRLKENIKFLMTRPVPDLELMAVFDSCISLT